MNPTLSITVDANRKATAMGRVAVGETVDISATCSAASAETTIRFRLVTEMGCDLVRAALTKTGDAFVGTVNFDTEQLRTAFYGIAFNERMELGIILDSTTDKAQYATGRVKVSQWAVASSEDPTRVPDWSVVLADLRTDLASVNASKTAAAASATAASQSSSTASTKAAEAAGSASSANMAKTQASASAQAAHDDRILAQSAKASAEAAKLAAEVAVTHYPQIGANGNWFVWNVSRGTYEDTGYLANGGHNIFKGKTFAKPTKASEWYALLAYLVREMGGNLDVAGITPGAAPNAVTLTAHDGTARRIEIVKSDGEYTTEVY